MQGDAVPIKLLLKGLSAEISLVASGTLSLSPSPTFWTSIRSLR